MTTDAAERFRDALTWARTNGLKAGLEIAVNFALPFVVYGATRERLGDVYALMAASAPPLIGALSSSCEDAASTPSRCWCFAASRSR